jgi:uncharacterized membrane protein YbhN (UPF0104 family)
VTSDPAPLRRRRGRRRLAWRVIWMVVVAVALIVVAARLGPAEHDLGSAYRKFRVQQVPWLTAALGAEVLSFYCYALVQRRLLLVGGAHMTRRAMLSLAVAATGVTNLVPGGTAPASGWLVNQYRRRGIPMPLALWAVLAGGYAATVSILFLLLLGAVIAGLVAVWVFFACLVVLLAGAGAAAVAAGHVPGLLARLDTHEGLARRPKVARVVASIRGASAFHPSPGMGAEILSLSLANWSLDVIVLIGSFGLLGVPIPWRAVLFAYATAQVAGSLAPLPGGIGFVEGGMIGAFALAGSPVGAAVAATVIYRAITCWLVAAVGSLMLVVIGRLTPRPVPVDAPRSSTE